MNLTEFINDFSRNHQVQKLDELDGVIIAKLNEDAYLVNTLEVSSQ